MGSLYAYAHGGVIYTIENSRDSSKKWFCLTYDVISRPFRNGYGEFNLVHEVLPEHTDRIYIPPCDTSFVRSIYSTAGAFYNCDNDGNSPTEHNHDSSKAKFFVLNTDAVEDITTAEVKLHRCAAEDTQFGGFASVPFMVLCEPLVLSYTGGGPGMEYKLTTGIIPNS